ncbi:MAG: hypothetical protein NTX13_20370 [Acidobacteria bacterium]|jgi:hypothetical protein|nr:hypothetical protein [Acidobacteriota bacterium]
MKLQSLLLLPAAALLAQMPGMDMAVMQKWSNAKVIRFQVTGVHKGRTSVVYGDYPGKADVVDKLNVEYTFNNKTQKITGEPNVSDFSSETTNIKSDGTNCPSPQLNGPYEHFKTVKQTLVGPNTIQITGNQIFPAASASQYPASCSLKPVPGHTVEKSIFLTIMDAAMLGMPIQSANKSMIIAPDRKSFTLVGADNWSWTYTPTIVE